MNPPTAAAAAKAESSYKIVSQVDDFEKTQDGRPEFDAHRRIEVTSPNIPILIGVSAMVSRVMTQLLYGTGKSTSTRPTNPCYFQVIDHDPPMFIVGLSSRPGWEKDTFQNPKETGECVINTVSVNMIKAVNACSLDAPYGISEWEVWGLHEASSTTVKPSRAQESVFSIEGKAIDIKEFQAHSEGMSVAGLVLIKATRFWVRDDATLTMPATSISTSSVILRS
ncbi:hypothetical protein VE02_07882 [Pseudogymnoascus sp. 03VT05]|nr:hypothetical protein VE02_07882 [Pseudogymnoascus sp. 03VT05]